MDSGGQEVRRGTCVAERVRRLTWEACSNIRDVGGYRTVAGPRTRWGALVRADDLCRLTPPGQAALVAYGVRTVIDLRHPWEVALAPHPFAPAPSGDDLNAASAGPRYRRLPLRDPNDAVLGAAVAAAPSTAARYLLLLDRCGTQLAAVAIAVATAEAGGVLVHCTAGRDRTGLVVAVLLALAGVPAGTIAADYALSPRGRQSRFEGARRRAGQPADPARPKAGRGEQIGREPVLALLAHLEAEHGGGEAYLRAAGVATPDLERLRARLVEPAAASLQTRQPPAGIAAAAAA
jgi:hypothetical protein